MDSYVEQYQAKHGGVILHTWTDVEGEKKDNFSITGVSGTPVAAWFRAVLHPKRLADIAVFPSSPSSVVIFASVFLCRDMKLPLTYDATKGEARRCTPGTQHGP